MAELEKREERARGKDGSQARKMPAKEKALAMYERMVVIRKYEERIYFLFLEGTMPGSIHQSHGQEACAVGMLCDLGPDDYMVTTHRPAGHDLAKGVSLKGMFCEMFAKANGCCHGKGGAMHTGDIAVGALPANAIVGGNLPIATGVGLAFKMQRKKNVIVAFFGDGASNEGAFHEALNAAAVWDLPVIFVCENNLYGASTPFSRTSKVADVANRASAYGMPGEIIDGQDVLAVNEAATRAIERARAGKGPTLLELKTYRIGGHSRNDPRGYRTREEEAAWAERDAIQVFRKVLLESRVAAAAELDAVDKRVEKEIDEAVEFAKASPDPKPEDALKNVYWEGAARP
jgi:acetoin:2,6-dichlorophenolindophenol oxidoreductase subunit alpha